MTKRLIPILMLLLVTLSSCDKSSLFPQASGRPYEVLVVMDSVEWKAPHGRALFDVLDTDVPMLPQSERSFRISQCEVKNFDRILNIFRNIIIVNIDKTQFTRTRMKFTRDKYAMEQVVLTINSPSKEEFQQFYADLYQETDFDTFLTNRANDAFYYGEAYETGTFYIKDNAMMMTEDPKAGELPTGEESLPYTIDGISLTLRYTDATHIYSRNAQ